MAFVLDASVTIVWAMKDEAHPLADLVLNQLDMEEALVPSIWWYEVRNILVINERRKRISESDASKFLRDLVDFPIRMTDISDHSDLLKPARQFGISVYDAAYLELAIRERIPLASLDKALRTAAQAASVPLLA